MFALLFVFSLIVPSQTTADKSLALSLRTRTETAPGTGRYHTESKNNTWDSSKTALVICDMWDKHTCPGATARVNELAPKVNALAKAIRGKGGLIIHCPSDTMAFYKDHPGRKVAQAAPKSATSIPLERWCKIDPTKEGKLPIDDSDGGCAEVQAKERAWTRQHPDIEIQNGDAITDSDEAYHLMRQRGITHVLICGVHTNMCVLGRPFAIRQLVKQGLTVALVRDLTDTMYNPAKAPFVSHFTGTDLVVEHIEKHWCGTITQNQILGGKEFRFKEDTRPHVVIVTAEDEYKTEETLPEFSLKNLGKHYRVSTVFVDAKDPTHLPGLEVLSSADAALFSIRRKPIKTNELEMVKAFIKSGKPLVAIRTTSHAFAGKKGAKTPEGAAEWINFDEEVLGCHYTGHHSNKVKTAITVVNNHPIVAGLPKEGFESTSWLYKSSPVASTATILLMGKAGDNPAEPAAWTFQRSDGGKVFYTCLGHPDDFKNPAFVVMLTNALKWATTK